MRSLAFRDNNRRRCACGTRDFGTPPGRGAPMKSERIIALVKPVGGADWVSFWLESALQLLFRAAAGSKTNRHTGIQERPRRGASCARGRSTDVGQVPVRIRRRNGACHHLLRRGPDLDRNRRHDSLDPGPSDGRPRHPRLIFNGSRVRAGSLRKTTNSSPRVEHPPPVLKKMQVSACLVQEVFALPRKTAGKKCLAGGRKSLGFRFANVSPTFLCFYVA